METIDNNRSPDMMNALAEAMQYQQTGRLAEARKACHRILTSDPHQGDALHLLGTIAFQTGNYENAATLISAAIRVDPQNPVYYISLGDALNAQSRQKQAVICYQKAIEAAPAHVEAYIKLGMLSHQQGKFNEAIGNYRKALQIKPDLAEVHYSIGLAYQAVNEWTHAIASYDTAIQLKPDDAEFHYHKGKALSAKGNLEQTASCFQRATRLKADFAEAYFSLGDTLCALGQAEAAIENYRHALHCRPNMFEAYNNLGNVFKARGDLEAAIENYTQVVRLKPDLAEAYYNLGSALRLKEDYEDAITHLKRALELKPQYAEACNNLGLAYKNTGDIYQAGEYFNRALQIKPQMAEARWNRSFIYLLNARFKEGWKDYDWRFEQARWQTLYPHRHDGLRWDGSICAGKTLFVHDEQGLGDTLQFVRYLPMAKARCANIIFETRQSLIPLLQGLPGVDQIVARSSTPCPAQNWDLYIPLLSLPKVFGTELGTIPNSVPYIHAHAKKIEHWNQRLDGQGFKVGLVWAGRPLHTNDHNRSCKLEPFLALSLIPGVQLIGLQKGKAAEQAQNLPAETALPNFGEEFEDFADTAGLLANLDLVISVDTAVAHLAGAMGKAVWVLLPFVPDWRWMMDREDSPWYPTMRLFRQKTQSDWESVFQRVAKELQTLVASATQRSCRNLKYG